jgi:hypothetical protein
MVGEQIAQFSFMHLDGDVPSKRTLISLGLVGDALEVSDIATVTTMPIVTKTLVDQLSTFGTHTESCEVQNGEEA